MPAVWGINRPPPASSRKAAAALGQHWPSPLFQRLPVSVITSSSNAIRSKCCPPDTNRLVCDRAVRPVVNRQPFPGYRPYRYRGASAWFPRSLFPACENLPRQRCGLRETWRTSRRLEIANHLPPTDTMAAAADLPQTKTAALVNAAVFIPSFERGIYFRSKRSRVITLVQALTKSLTNFSWLPFMA